jgi:hypothetical protein
MSLSARATGARAHRSGALHVSPLRAVLAIGALGSGTAVLLAACSTSLNAGSAAPHRALAAVPGGAPGRAARAPTATGASSGSLVLSVQRIIYTANLTLRVKDVTTKAAVATGIATGAGGYVAGEQEIIPHRNGTPLITLVLKIPVTAYHATLSQLTSLGSPISVSQHAQDVTQRVADVTSRVASARAAISQLRALLRKAGTVVALLRVQNQINTQEASLESLLAQQQALLHETSYATVTVTFLGHHVVIPKKASKKAAGGFGSGLRAGWHALVVMVRWLLTALGAALPFAIPLGLLAVIAFQGRRRLARRRLPLAADPPAADPPAAA